MSMLLFVEEFQHERDIRQFDMEGVTMTPSGKYLALLVGGWHTWHCWWVDGVPGTPGGWMAYLALLVGGCHAWC